MGIDLVPARHYTGGMTQTFQPDAVAGQPTVTPSGRTHVTIRRRAYEVTHVQDLAALRAAGYPLTAENMALRGWDAQGHVRVSGGFYFAFRLDRLQQWVVVGAKVRDAAQVTKEVR